MSWCRKKRNDCCGCDRACVEYPGPSYLHVNGRPFCVNGHEVEVLGLLQEEGMREGHMRPKRNEAKRKGRKRCKSRKT